MAFKWSDLQELDEIAAIQDPRQNWLLTRDNGDDDRLDDAAILAIAFRFATARNFDDFRRSFDPGDVKRSVISPAEERVVIFPELPDDKIREDPVHIVGFARFGLIREMLEVLSGLDGENTLFTTGVPFLGELAFAPFPPPPETDEQCGPIHVVIDTEIAFANTRFLATNGGTRIRTFWDMGATRIDPSDPILIGRYLDADTIDQLRNDFMQAGNVDEWALYARYDGQAHRPATRQRLPMASGHGTHVLDLFTGEPDRPGGHADIPIVAIALPQWAVDQTHGFFLFPFIKLIFDWIRTWPSDTGNPQVNFSFGGIAGPHDGEDAMERLFDDAIADGVVSAVNIPSGNSFDSDTHARLSAARLAEPQTLEWTIQPDDGTESFLQIWLPECNAGRAAPNVTLTLTLPTGLSQSFPDNQPGIRTLFYDGRVAARVFTLCQALPFGAPLRSLFLVAIRHTAPFRRRFGFPRGIPDLAGGWQVTLAAESLAEDQRIQLWIERDDALPGAKSGARQSYFTAPRPVWPDPPPTDPPVTNAGTLSDIATGAETLVAGAYVRAMRQPSAYSSEGFTEPFRNPPTLATIADDSRVHDGVLAAGTFSGSVAARAGTSAASAVAARAVSVLAAGGVTPTRANVQAFAAAEDTRALPPSAQIDPVFGTYPGGVPPQSRAGSGCVETPWTRMERFVPRT